MGVATVVGSLGALVSSAGMAAPLDVPTERQQHHIVDTRLGLRPPAARQLDTAVSQSDIERAVHGFTDPKLDAKAKADAVIAIARGDGDQKANKEQKADNVRLVLTTVKDLFPSTGRDTSFQDSKATLDALKILTVKYYNADPERKLECLLKSEIEVTRAGGLVELKDLFKSIYQDAGKKSPYDPKAMAATADKIVAESGVEPKEYGAVLADSLERLAKYIDREKDCAKQDAMKAAGLVTIHELDKVIGSRTYGDDKTPYITDERVNRVKSCWENRESKTLAYSSDEFTKVVSAGRTQAVLDFCASNELNNHQVETLFTEYLRKLKTTEKNDGTKNGLSVENLEKLQSRIQNVKGAFEDKSFREEHDYREACDGAITDTLAYLSARIIALKNRR